MREIFRLALWLSLAVVAAASHAQQASKHNGAELSWPSFKCFADRCEPLTAKGWYYAQPGAKAVVLISHGSVGVDYRVFDRVDVLRQNGFAALVIDHWGSRGIGEVLTDLAGSLNKGASEANMAFDIYTAASMLRREPHNFDKVGAIGASFGGGAMVTSQQKWVKNVIEKTYEYHYKKPFVVRPLDAQVALYTWCGHRHKVRDAYNGSPLLIINGDRDEMNAGTCERYVPWMNERGGQAQLLVLKGAVHGFDAREPARFIPGIYHSGKCNLVQDEKGVLDEATGKVTAGSGAAAVVAALTECSTARGFTNGYTGESSRLAVEAWTGFLKQHLAE